jgi:hypothetical protein
MDTYTGGVISGDIVKFILDHNAAQSAGFTDPGAQLKRRLYRAQHPTEILVMKCMDGRLNMALYTETPPGILQPFRNIGAKFDLGWPYFQEIVRDAVNFSTAKGRECLMISSYHFSKGDTHRGCAGFGYDTQAAMQAAFTLQEQFCRAAGGPHVVHPAAFAITVGMETDEESLIFHGENGKELRVAELDPATSAMDIRVLLQELYPRMSAQMIADILPLVSGNIDHVREVRKANKKPIDCEHREQIITVGGGVDWLHMHNTALIIGPYSLAWPDNVRVAGTIVKSNLDAGRIPEDPGVLLLVAALHRTEQGSFGAELKKEKVRYMLEQSLRALEEGVPELMSHIRILAGVVSADTRKLALLES